MAYINGYVDAHRSWQKGRRKDHSVLIDALQRVLDGAWRAIPLVDSSLACHRVPSCAIVCHRVIMELVRMGLAMGMVLQA
jgi:hypothetical protein